MPGGLSVKVAAVLAALAFAGGFRVQASRGQSSEPPAAPSSVRAHAVRASGVATPARVALPRLSRVAALPALRKSPARRHRKARARTAATPGPTATPTATPVATPQHVAAPPTTKPNGNPYVGKSFDTNG